MRQKLTFLITCKDERANIGPCIESAAPIADEILVADSGSTDGTVEYVRARGDCRLIEREYHTAGHFKNWAIPHASHSWIFVLDADERATPELAREIQTVLAAPKHDAYRIRRSNRLMGHTIRHGDWGRDWLIRLFRREVCYVAGPSDHGSVHVRTGNVGRLKHPMDHFTIWEWDHYLKKFDRYTRVQAEQWKEENRRAPSYLRMLLQPPLRFLRDYVVHLGFLEGSKGLQLAYLSAFYTFMKQARLWELQRGLKQSDVEPEAIAKAERKAA